MVDESQRARTIRLGNLARDVLENDAFLAALNMAMNDTFAEFLATSAEEEKVRERLWSIGQALDIVRRRLEAMVNNGKVELENRKIDEDNHSGD